MGEVPLVFFTVFAQSAAGLVILGFIANQLKHIDQTQLNKINLVSLILFGLGFAVGMLHLGHPFRAVNIMFGIGRSAMSNESLFAGAFGGLLLATVFFNYKKNEKWAKLCNIATAIVSVIFAWSVTMVYHFETVATWGNGYTLFHMWMTVIMGGSALAMCLGVRKIGSAILFVSIMISLFYRPDYLIFITETASELASEQGFYWGVQLVCLALGSAVAFVSLTQKEICSKMLWAGAVFIIVGELAARMAFYDLWTITM